MADWEVPAATAVAGLAFLQLHNAYTSAAPSLSDLRQNPRDSIGHQQQLMDADFMVGVLAVGIGATVSALTGRWLIFWIVLGGAALTSWWHHQVLAAPTIDTGGPEQ